VEPANVNLFLHISLLLTIYFVAYFFFAKWWVYNCFHGELDNEDDLKLFWSCTKFYGSKYVMRGAFELYYLPLTDYLCLSRSTGNASANANPINCVFFIVIHSQNCMTWCLQLINIVVKTWKKVEV